jgi:hypothetical protein
MAEIGSICDRRPRRKWDTSVIRPPAIDWTDGGTSQR